MWKVPQPDTDIDYREEYTPPWAHAQLHTAVELGGKSYHFLKIKK